MKKAVFILLWCLVFIVPWEGMFVIEEFATAARLFGTVAFAAAVVAVVASASMRRLHVIFIPMAGFVLWNWLSLAWSIVPEESVVRCITYSLLLTFAWLIWEFAASPKAQRSLLWAFILGNSLILAATYAQFFLGEAPGMRYAAAETNANGVALYAVFSICFLLYCMNNLGRGLRIASWGYILAAGVGTFLTLSRSGIGGLFICVFFSLASFRRIGWKAALGILFCLASGWFLVSRTLIEQLGLRTEEGAISRAADIRYELWAAGLATWKTNPLLGLGAGSDRTATEMGGSEHANVAHNTFVSLLVEGGLIGLALFISMCLLLFRLIWRMPPRERNFWITVLASYSLNWIVGSVQYYKPTWLIFALIAAQSEAFRRPRVPRSAPPRPGRVAVPGPEPKKKRNAR